MGKIKHGVSILVILVLSISAFVLFNDNVNFQLIPNDGEIKGVKTVVVSGKTKPENPLKNSPFYYLGIFKKIPLTANRSVALINHAVFSGLGVAIIDDHSNFITWLPEAELKYIGEGTLEYAGEILDWWVFKDLDNDNKKDLAVQFGNTGTAMVHPFYLYSYDGSNFRLLLKLVEASSKTEIRDLDKDWPEEIVHSYSISGIGKLERDLLRWKDIWRLENGKVIKVNYQFPQEYKELIKLYNLALNKKGWEPDAKPYYPTIRCLKNKAQFTIQGKTVDIKNCRELMRKRYD
jgi:hypothetical protein